MILIDWVMLVHECALWPGETVLAWVGGSDVGSVAQAGKCWELGAEHGIVRDDLKALTAKVRDLTGKRDVDVVAAPGAAESSPVATPRV